LVISGLTTPYAGQSISRDVSLGSFVISFLDASGAKGYSHIAQSAYSDGGIFGIKTGMKSLNFVSTSISVIKGTFSDSPVCFKPQDGSNFNA